MSDLTVKPGEVVVLLNGQPREALREVGLALLREAGPKKKPQTGPLSLYHCEADSLGASSA